MASLQLSLFCLEYRIEALKTLNLSYKGSNTNLVHSFKHVLQKLISRLFQLIFECLFICSSWWCSKGQEFWKWFPRKTNSNLILVQLLDKLRLTFPCVWGGRPEFPLWNSGWEGNSSFLIFSLCQKMPQEQLKWYACQLHKKTFRKSHWKSRDEVVPC